MQYQQKQLELYQSRQKYLIDWKNIIHYHQARNTGKAFTIYLISGLLLLLGLFSFSMIAGLLGFVSPGGLSVGMPSGAAVPGTVLAGVNVTAPTAFFGEATIGTATCGIMDAVLMTDIITSAIYNSHIHTSPKGPTSPPLMRFFGV
jgi:hypothetical protein